MPLSSSSCFSTCSATSPLWSRREREARSPLVQRHCSYLYRQHLYCKICHFIYVVCIHTLYELLSKESLPCTTSVDGKNSYPLTFDRVCIANQSQGLPDCSLEFLVVTMATSLAQQEDQHLLLQFKVHLFKKTQKARIQV